VLFASKLKRLASRFWHNLRKQSKDRMIDSALQSKNRLVLVLTNAIVAITSMHNHMGNVAEYLVNPMCVRRCQERAHINLPLCVTAHDLIVFILRYAGAKITPLSTESDVQSSFQGLNIALTTAVPMPKLMNDFSHLLHNDDKRNQTRAVFARFQVTAHFAQQARPADPQRLISVSSG
jgi:hypothetical protein